MMLRKGVESNAQGASHRMKNEAPVVVISGGSSGIGLEIASLLAKKGYRLALLARDPERLAAAQASLQTVKKTDVLLLPVDVTQTEACGGAIDEVIRKWGRIDWLVTSAGQVEPGLFLEADQASFRRQMETNYFGTLSLVHPVARIMQAQGQGRITLVSSAAAFIGVAGYSAYAPSKFAVRGLAEVLAVELKPSGISVSLAMPPDTDTPQLAGEMAIRPEVTRRIAAGGGVMSAEAVARSIVGGALAGRFLLAPGWLMTLYGLIHSLYAPLFRRSQLREMSRPLG